MRCPAAPRAPEAQTSIDQLCQGDTDSARAHALMQAFLTRVRERRGAQLEAWMAEAMPRDIDGRARFACGRQDDLPAIKAGLTRAWRNGVPEGPIHRLKLLKRQGYGRAGGFCRKCSCGDDVKRVDPIGGLIRRPGSRTVRPP
jgi:transposase